jgi:cellulose synthase/poly-beta-1,6-N-acetylglucosamine synthase-like glycosyltransferase
VDVVTGLSLGVLGYTHLGYPLVIAGLARLSPNKIRIDPLYRPLVTVCIPSHNGEGHLGAKLESLLAQSYPAEKIEILVYSDGSTDRTEEIVRQYAARDPRIKLIVSEECRGKPTALNHMRREASGELLVLTDARQPLGSVAVAALVEALGDPEVACVTGNLVLKGAAGSGFYWKYENWIRKSEARFRSVVGITGPLSAIRKSDLSPIPDDIILDDVWIPMKLRLQGRKVLLREDAVVYDDAFKDKREFARKVRTLAGNYQIFARMPALLDPRANPSWFETMSHKVMRLVCPWALLALFGATAVGAVSAPTSRERLVQRLLLGAQLAAYAAAVIGPRGGRVPGIARTFVMMHAAALMGLWRFLRGQQKITWQLPPSTAHPDAVPPAAIDDRSEAAQ